MSEHKNNAKEFVEAVLKDEALRAKLSESTLEEALGIARERGYAITADEMKSAAEELAGKPEELSPDMLEGIAGGTAFTAGSSWFNESMSCPSYHGNAYRTGNEDERSFFFFWSQHIIEYHCPDCGATYWLVQEHDDPPKPN